MQSNKINNTRRIFSTPKTKTTNMDDTPISSHNKSPKILQLIEAKFSKQNEIMRATIIECVKTSVDEAVRAIEDKISILSVRVEELNDKINIIENKNEQKQQIVQNMQSELKILKKQLSQQENLKVSCNFRLCGVPFLKNEHLPTILQNLCTSLNVMPPNFKSIQRLKQNKNNPATTNDGVILVKLFSPQERNNILKAANVFKRENKTPLPLRLIGFDTDVPFFINEDLTNANYKILKEAISIKKKKQISAAFTLRGLVYVKRFDAATPICVESVDYLNNLFRASHQPTNCHSAANQLS